MERNKIKQRTYRRFYNATAIVDYLNHKTLKINLRAQCPNIWLRNNFVRSD